MAKCKTCDRTVPFWANQCDECVTAPRRKREAEAAEAEVRRYRETVQQLELLRDNAIEAQLPGIVEYVASGGSLELHEKVYLSVDSFVDNNLTSPEFNISALVRYGCSGWRVVGVVPRTTGVALTNISIGTSGGGTTWGAGMGGNVIGVYVLMTKTVTSATENLEEVIRSYVTANLEAFLEGEQLTKYRKLAAVI